MTYHVRSHASKVLRSDADRRELASALLAEKSPHLVISEKKTSPTVAGGGGFLTWLKTLFALLDMLFFYCDRLSKAGYLTA
jgi:hypothetical protein